MKINFKILIVTLIVGVLFVFAGCGNNEEVTTSEAIAVEVGTVSLGKISNESRISGKLEGEKSVYITPKMVGKVANVYVKMGDSVSAGQIIASLDTADYKAQLDQSQAAYDMAMSSYNQANVLYQDAKKNYDRMKTLYNEGAISLQQLEQAESAVKTANISVAQGQVDQAKASLRAIKQTLSNANITSPISGVVASISAKTGEMVAQSPIAQVISINKMIVSAGVTESQVNSIKKGDKINILVSAVSDTPYVGTVKAVSPAADPQKLTYAIEILIANTDRQLKTGMVAEAIWSPNEKTDVIVIPKDSLIEEEGETFVFTVVNAKAVKVPVKVGMTSESSVEIISGINVGEQLVVTGQHLLTDGANVKLVGEE